MRMRCPSCQSEMNVSDEIAYGELSCNSCGSTFAVSCPGETLGFENQADSPAQPAAIAQFRLLDKLGAGAFGVVWKAYDTKLDRYVAIKIPKVGLDSEAQFIREARAAAQLHHSGIVSVHEVGRHHDQIYIVSDFIEGEPLSDRLQRGLLELTEAVQLCVELADALEHAHRSGVVHRDLKPSNIMLARGKPHIMDFGLAKRDVSEMTLTLEGQIMGTPAYMSPEQARGEASSVDCRSDVYSLGVILFELFTGELPFRGSLRMLLEQVVHDEPPSPRKLNARVPKDLETICLKCLRKSPDDRYPTAAAFAADLVHWLNKEPITARPISAPHRLRMWCQRRPTVAALLATVVAVTVVGFAGVTWQWRKAERLRVTAEENLAESERQRTRREANFERSLEAVDRLLTYIGEKSLADVPKMEGIRRSMLEDAASFYVGFVSESSEDPDVLAESARANLRVADIRDMLDDTQVALEAYDDAVKVLTDLCNSIPTQMSYARDLGDALARRGRFHFRQRHLELAERDLQQSIETQQQLLGEEPLDEQGALALAGRINAMATLHEEAGQGELFEEDVRRALSTLDGLANSPEKAWHEASARFNRAVYLVEVRVDNAQAEAELVPAIEILQKLVAGLPDNVEYRQRLIEAIRLLAIVHVNVNRIDDAEKQFEVTATARKQLAEDYPHVPRYQMDHAAAVGDWAICNARAGRMQRAEELFIEAKEIQQRLVREAPLPDYRRLLATNLENLGAMTVNSGRPQAAQAFFEQSLEVRQGLMNEFPDVELYQLQVNISATNLANAIFITEMQIDREISDETLARADGLLDLALQVGLPLITRQAADPINQHKLAITYRTRGQLWADIDAQKAEKCFLDSIAIMRSLVEQMPQDNRFHRQLHYSLDQLAEIYVQLEMPQAAEQVAREANALVKQLAENSQVFAYRLDLAINTRKLGDLLADIESDDEALTELLKAVDLCESLLAEVPDNEAAAEQLAETHNSLAYLLATSEFADVLDTAKAVEHGRLAISMNKDSLPFRSHLGIAYYRNGDFELASQELAFPPGPSPEQNPEACLHLAMCLWQLGAKQEAVDLYTRTNQTTLIQTVPTQLLTEAKGLITGDAR